MIGLWHHHPALTAIICFYVVSAAVNSMPTPTEQSSSFYHWFFKFSQTMLANFMRIPEVRNLLGTDTGAKLADKL